jgi:transketolase
VEEHTIDGGLGSCVAEVCLERGVVPQTFYRIGIRTGYSALIGSQSYLRTLYDMDAAAIASRVREKLSPNAVRAISQ